MAIYMYVPQLSVDAYYGTLSECMKLVRMNSYGGVRAIEFPKHETAAVIVYACHHTLTVQKVRE